MVQQLEKPHVYTGPNDGSTEVSTADETVDSNRRLRPKLPTHNFLHKFTITGEREFQDKFDIIRPLGKFNFLLNWNSQNILTYVSSMHPSIETDTNLNSPFVYLEEFEDDALLALVIDRSTYSAELSTEINGFLTFFGEPDLNFVEEIPDLLLSSEDLHDSSINLGSIQQDTDLIDFYTRLVCSLKVDIVIELDENEQIADLLINGGLQPLGAGEDIPKRFYTIINKSPVFDDTILEVKDMKKRICDVSIYTKDEKSLLDFVHYLCQKIKPLVLLPAEYKERIPVSTDSEIESELQSRMTEEIEFLKSLISKDPIESGEYKELRSQLVDLEHKTDVAYLATLVAQDKQEAGSSDETQNGGKH